MSKTEILLNEFVGIPGLKLDILTPSSFIIRDESCNNKNNPIKEIKVTINDIDITFEVFRQTSFSSGLFVISTFTQFEGYEQYRLLKFLTEDLLKYLSEEHKRDDNYSPSIAWLNVSIRLGLISVHDKTIKTTYNYKLPREVINFYLELPSDELFAKIENVEKLTSDNLALNTQLISMTRIAETLEDYKSILLKLVENAPIVIENTKSLSIREIDIINELNSRHCIEPVHYPEKESGVKEAISSGNTEFKKNKEEFDKLINAVNSSDKETEVIISGTSEIKELDVKKEAISFVEKINEIAKQYSNEKNVNG